MAITLTKFDTQVILNSTDPGTKTVNIPGSDSSNNGFSLDIKDTVGTDPVMVVPESGTIEGLPCLQFTGKCDLALRSNAAKDDWLVRWLNCYEPVECPPPVVVGITGGTWDPSAGGTVFVTPLQTYSDGNFVVTPPNVQTGGFPSTVWRSTSSNSTGKWYFEIQAFGAGSGIITFGSQLIGLMNASYPVNGNINQLGSTLDSVGLGGFFVNTQGVWIGNTQYNHWPELYPTLRSWIGIAVDLDNRLIWLETSLVPGTSWNFSPTANPASGIGGWSIALLNSGPYFIGMSMVVYGLVAYPSFRIITGDNIATYPFLGPQPSGYGTW